MFAARADKIQRSHQQLNSSQDQANLTSTPSIERHYRMKSIHERGPIDKLDFKDCFIQKRKKTLKKNMLSSKELEEIATTVQAEKLTHGEAAIMFNITKQLVQKIIKGITP